MAITVMAPGEKSEHLIYAILPISIAFYFLVQWEISSLSLSLASLAASFLMLFLFELSPDEIFVKSLFRRLSGSKYGYQKRRILLWNIFLRPWDYELSDFDEEKDAKKLEKEISHISEVSVSSSLVSPRLWRLRGEIFLLFSIPFLIATLTIVLNKLVLSPIMVASVWFPFIQQLSGTFNSIGIGIMLFLDVILFVAVIYKHRHLGKDIRYLAQFRYLERSLALARMKKGEKRPSSEDPTKKKWADEFKERTEKVWTEIALQNEILKTGDWTFFIDRSSRWGRVLTKEISDEIEYQGLNELMDSWTRLASPETTDNEKYWKKLVWAHYYFKKILEYGEIYTERKDDDPYPMFDEPAEKLINLIGKKIKIGSDDFTKADDLLDIFVTMPLKSQPFLPLLRSISFALNWSFDQASGAGLTKLMTAFNTKNESPFDRAKAAKAVIHIFKGEVSEGNTIWGEGDTPYIRLSNIIKAVGCKINGLDKVVRHCIELSPGASMMSMVKDKGVHDCITDLGLKNFLEERMAKSSVP